METREIKFRVWDGVDYMSQPFTLRDLQEQSIGFIEDAAIMQFTGLLDNNGKEIFENDLVKFNSLTHGEAIGIIQWKQEACQYWIKWVQIGKERNVNRYKPLTATQGGDEYYDTRVEVIGNIYENPELLNK